MAETRASLCRTLAAVALAAALAGCAATHVGDDWQCPLAQGEVCTSIAAADPAVVPERAPPRLATRAPLYRAPETETAAPEAKPAATMEPGAEPRPCTEGCSPLAWLGRLLAPRAATAETAEAEEAVFAAPVEETPAPIGTVVQDETPCGAGDSASESATTPVDGDDEAEPIDGAGTPCPIAATEPIGSSATAAISCGTDDAPDIPAESPKETAGTTDAPAPDDSETPCADPAPAGETAAAETGELAEAAESTGTTPEDSPATAAAAAAPPTSAALLAPPGPDALRTGEVVGRIWIAPFVDAGGVYREGAWVRAVLAPARWRR